jgi:hypothetical protein
VTVNDSLSCFNQTDGRIAIHPTSLYAVPSYTWSTGGEKHDRDFNASKNILKQGLKTLSGSGIESDIKQKQVEAMSLDKSMKPETH